MLYCNRIDLSAGIDLTKKNSSERCLICHYRLLNHGFKFQDSECNGSHDLTMLCVNISDIVTVKNADYLYTIHDINKFEAINLLNNSVLENRGNI